VSGVGTLSPYGSKPTRIRTRGRHRWVGFDEERAPSGEPGLRAVYLSRPFEPLHWPDLGDCLVSRPRPFALVIWEPLLTKAPAPDKALPYCCYSRSVIFYHRPYIVRPWRRIYRANGRLTHCRAGFEQWDKIEYRLAWNDQVEFEGEVFDVGGGTVVWAQKRWWMCHGARRKAVAS
jgi:hypothetical protein